MRRRSTARRFGFGRGLVPAVAVLALAAAGLACGPSEQASGDARAEVEALLEDYLPRLPEVYRTGDLAPLQGLAAPREMERIEAFIRDRAQEGQVVDPELESFEVVDFNLYQHSNAYVTTREVWNLRLRAAGSDRLLSDENAAAQPYRYSYQVRREEGGDWRVLSREVMQQPPP